MWPTPTAAPLHLRFRDISYISIMGVVKEKTSLGNPHPVRNSKMETLQTCRGAQKFDPSPVVGRNSTLQSPAGRQAR